MAVLGGSGAWRGLDRRAGEDGRPPRGAGRRCGSGARRRKSPGGRGRKIYYGTLTDLVDSLEEAKAAGRLDRRLKILTHPALLVVDEIGYLPVTQSGLSMPITGTFYMPIDSQPR